MLYAPRSCVLMVKLAITKVTVYAGDEYNRTWNATIISLIEPVSAVVSAFVILSQQIASVTLIGGGLILLGGMMVSVERGMEAAHE